MGLYSAAELKVKIEALDARIAKAEQAQSYEAGVGMRLERGSLAAMYRERERLCKEYERQEAKEGGGAVNYAEFGRPQ